MKIDRSMYSFSWFFLGLAIGLVAGMIATRYAIYENDNNINVAYIEAHWKNKEMKVNEK